MTKTLPNKGQPPSTVAPGVIFQHINFVQHNQTIVE
jgi:hypothetical protein